MPACFIRLLVENIHFLETSNSDYVVIAPAHIITTMDYNDVITAHEKSGASITMVYRKAKDADVAWVGCDVLDIDKDGLLTGKTINKGTSSDRQCKQRRKIRNLCH